MVYGCKYIKMYSLSGFENSLETIDMKVNGNFMKQNITTKL